MIGWRVVVAVCLVASGCSKNDSPPSPSPAPQLSPTEVVRPSPGPETASPGHVVDASEPPVSASSSAAPGLLPRA
ncbi:MAG: hypothetical protein M3O50_11180, partial [Myxococcota bacterium]|nr:hypothetical protein [Myxococcota bacterium]